MEDREIQLEKAIKQAAASVRMDNLPLSQNYVNNFRWRMLKKFREGKKLTLKRCNNGTESNKSV